MSDTPKTLTDEIEALADDAFHYSGTPEAMDRFRTRLQEIEAELTELRKEKVDFRNSQQVSGRTTRSVMAGLEQYKRKVEAEIEDGTRILIERTPALPCSNTEYDGEDGG